MRVGLLAACEADVKCESTSIRPRCRHPCKIIRLFHIVSQNDVFFESDKKKQPVKISGAWVRGEARKISLVLE